MQYIKITPEISLSSLCFGTEQLGGTDWGDLDLKKIEEAIHLALDLGINFFDTADIYGLGLSEERLSQILGKRRKEIFIATKGGYAWSSKKGSRAQTYLDSSPEYLTKAVNKSLGRLRLDCIPIYYIHWPDPKTEMRRTFECLANLRKEGKIAHIGCSNFTSDQIEEASKYANIDFLQADTNILIGFPPEKLLKVCRRLKIKVVAYNVLASGFLTGKYDMNSEFPENDRRSRSLFFKGENYKKVLSKIEKLKSIAENQELTLTQYAIKSVIDSGKIDFIITGIKSPSQLKENITSFL